ncbi:MAG: efflux RND transporter periplasmic adaptor subunit [Maribacter sp.]
MKNLNRQTAKNTFKDINLNIYFMKSFQYITFLLSSLLFIACGESVNKSENTSMNFEESLIELSKAQFESGKMQFGNLSEQSFPSMVQSTGMVDVPPQSRAIISSFTGGYVQKTPLLVGNKVRKGQVLATLENPEFVEMQQNYLETTQKLTYLKSEYDRQKTLIEEQISSQKNFLKAESDYKSALAFHNGLKKKLQMLNIDISAVEAGNITSEIALYAPIHGSVTKMNISKGTYVSAADEIMEIINTDHIHLELAVFEKDILKIKEGQKILFNIPEALEDTFEAEVHLVGTSIDTKNRTVKVHGHLDDDENHNFALGMFVDARIITVSNQELALPENAVVAIDEKYYVLLKSGDENSSYLFSKKEVSIGSTFNGYTSIKNGANFTENDVFLVKGAFNLIRAEE